MLETDPIPQPVAPAYLVTKRQRVRCVLCFLVLILTGFFGVIFMMAPLLPLAYLTPSFFLLLMDCGVRMWCMLSEVLLCGILRIQIRLFGDDFVLPSSVITEAVESTSTGTSSLLILNHRTRLDWIFAFSLGRYARHLKVVLKRELSNLPGVGWAMQMDGFIFLRRRIAVDLARIQQAVEYLLRLQGSAHILLFPEGTDLSVYGLKKSDVFAAKAGLPRYRYTLHPHTTGFETFARALGSELAYVYDVTVAYPYALTESELRMATGHCPQEVHFHVRRWPAHQLPRPTDAALVTNNGSTINTSPLARWVQERWAEKEQMLKDYYALPPDDRRFPGPEISREGAVISGSDDQWSPGACAVLAYWLIFLAFSITVLWCHWVVQLYVVAMTIFFIYRGRESQGLAEWLAELAGVPLTPDKTHSTD
ncbi:Lysocardiolipin acyltransferase 1 [Echinococcus granulosus]|nr:Lysocardiolipin acyltransferase 1 [Echinococcus granulosus]